MSPKQQRPKTCKPEVGRRGQEDGIKMPER